MAIDTPPTSIVEYEIFQMGHIALARNGMQHFRAKEVFRHLQTIIDKTGPACYAANYRPHSAPQPIAHPI